MDEYLSHVDLQMLESRVSNLTPSYWRSDCDNRPCGRIYYIKHGAGFVRSFGRECPLVAGRIYLIPPNGDLAYGCSTETQIWWMHFRASVFGFIDLFDYLDHDCCLEPNDPAVLERSMTRLLDTARSGRSADQLEGMGILLQLIAPFFHDQAETTRADQCRDQRRFLPVLRYIDANLGGRLTVEGLARTVQLETSYFSSLFSKAFGMSPMRYVKRQRIERLQLVLRRSDATLDHLAEEFGFRDAFHLSKTFKHETGQSPRDFRQNRGETVP